MGRSRGELLERAARHACRGSGRTCPQRPDDVAAHRGCPTKVPKRSQTGASSAWHSSSRPVHRSTSASSSPSNRRSCDRVGVPATPCAAPERHDHDGRSATLQLLPYRRPPANSCRAGRNRAACTRAASRPVGVAQRSPDRCLARRARTLEPPTCDVDTWDHDRPAAASAARSPTRAPGSRGSMALGAPLLQPGQAIAHDRLLNLARFGRLDSRGARNGRGRLTSAPSGAPAWSPVWSPFSCRAPTFAGSRWRSSNRVRAVKALLLTRFGSP